MKLSSLEIEIQGGPKNRVKTCVGQPQKKSFHMFQKSLYNLDRLNILFVIYKWLHVVCIYSDTGQQIFEN